MALPKQKWRVCGPSGRNVVREGSPLLLDPGVGTGFYALLFPVLRPLVAAAAFAVVGRGFGGDDGLLLGLGDEGRCGFGGLDLHRLHDFLAGSEAWQAGERHFPAGAGEQGFGDQQA